MKIFYFDLDGTLLNKEKQITPATYAALREWHEAGNILAISSGRPLMSVLSVIEEQKLLPFHPYAIAFNGAQIYDCIKKENVWIKHLSMEDVRFVAESAHELGLYCHCYDDGGICTPMESRELAFYTRVVKLPYRLLPDFPEGITQEPCKMLCIDLDESDREDILCERIRNTRGDRISSVRSNAWYLEIFPSDAGKGAAVTALADYLSVDIKDTYAAGDAGNDVSMLEAAGCGIAMCNGDAVAIEAADIVTDTDNDHDGLAPLLLSFR